MRGKGVPPPLIPWLLPHPHAHRHMTAVHAHVQLRTIPACPAHTAGGGMPPPMAWKTERTGALAGWGQLWWKRVHRMTAFGQHLAVPATQAPCCRWQSDWPAMGCLTLAPLQHLQHPVVAQPLWRRWRQRVQPDAHAGERRVVACMGAGWGGQQQRCWLGAVKCASRLQAPPVRLLLWLPAQQCLPALPPCSCSSAWTTPPPTWPSGGRLTSCTATRAPGPAHRPSW